MKDSPTFRLFATVCLLLCLYFPSSSQTATHPTYPLKFRFTNSTGIAKDTILTRQAYKYWCSNSNTQYPAYVQWREFPFAIMKSQLSGVGLFTDSLHSLNPGDTIGWAYFKVANTGRFDISYFQTNLASFINDADSPTATVVSTPNGLLLIANQHIPPLTEIDISYQSILNLFPGDPSVDRAIKYW